MAKSAGLFCHTEWPQLMHYSIVHFLAGERFEI